MTVENENQTLVAQLPITIKLADGKSYKLAPILVPDVAEFEQWMIDEKIRTMDRLKRHSSYKEKIECDLAIIHDPIVELEYLKAATFKGMMKHVWYSLRQNHPELKESEVGKLVTPESIYYVIAIINAAGGSPEDPFERTKAIIATLQERTQELIKELERMQKPAIVPSTNDVAG